MTRLIESQFGNVTLYEKLGASAGIRTLVDETVDELSQNPTLEARFAPCLEGQKGLGKIKQQVCEFVSARTGGPDISRIRDMTDALCKMSLSEAEYSAAVAEINASMTMRGYDAATRSEVVAILNFMKADIVSA